MFETVWSNKDSSNGTASETAQRLIHDVETWKERHTGAMAVLGVGAGIVAGGLLMTKFGRALFHDIDPAVTKAVLGEGRAAETSRFWNEGKHFREPFQTSLMGQKEALHFQPDGLLKMNYENEFTGNWRYSRYGENEFVIHEDKATPAYKSETLKILRLMRSESGFIEDATNHGWSNFSKEASDFAHKVIPENSVAVGLGRSRQAWQTGYDEVVVIGPHNDRPDIPGLLRPRHTERVGDKQFEWFPYGESLSVKPHEVEAVDARMGAAGYRVEDSHTFNYLRLRDGSVWRADPDEIHEH